LLPFAHAQGVLRWRFQAPYCLTTPGIDRGRDTVFPPQLAIRTFAGVLHQPLMPRGMF
jgi:hypothetical protein